MEHYGMAIGIGLLLLVTATAFGIGAVANRQINAFREESHKNFLGTERK